jgi:hypothetical protein
MGESGAEMVSESDVEPYLGAVDYPAERDAIVAAAAAAGAPDEVLRALRAMPPVEYRSRAEVLRSAHVDPAAEVRTPSRRARQAREGNPRVAQHLRDV